MYCVYLTSYRGNLLPQFYIGSSSVEKVNSGYRGSVHSIKYKSVWKSELKNNPHLFKTYIISTHKSRKDAFVKENSFHIKLNVVKSLMYINESNAIPNFDGTVNKGRTLTEQVKNKISMRLKGIKKSEEFKQKLRIPKSTEHAAKIANRNRERSHLQIGIKFSDETREKQSIAHKGKSKKFNIGKVCVFDLSTNKFIKVSSIEYQELKGIRYLTTTAYKKLQTTSC